MKIKFLIPILLFLFLVTACGQNVEEEIFVNENVEEMVSEDEKKEYVEKIETTEDLILYEEDGISLILRTRIDLDFNAKRYYIHMINENEQRRSVEIDQWVINDKLVMKDFCYLFAEAGDEYIDRFTSLTSDLYYLEEQSVRSVQCHLSVRDENYEIIKETELFVEAEKPLVPAIRYDEFMGVCIKEQVLCDDEKVRIVLKYFGKELDRDYLMFVIFMENKSEERIPVMVSGMAINDIFMELYDHETYLEPGEYCYTVESIQESKIQDAGIHNISDLKIMILTEEAQNTGVVTMDGGIWYPVVLENSKETAEELEKGELLQRLGDIEIYYVSQERTEYSELTEHAGYYWNLTVVNGSDKNIELEILDIMQDGVPEDELYETIGGGGFYVDGRDVGAQTSKYVTLVLSSTEDIPTPEVSFKIRVKSMAGDEILYVSDDRITITPNK